jgi:NADPH2:quinone reductase
MAFGGRYLVVGFSCGDIPVISVNYPLIKGFSIIGVRAGEYGRQFPDLGAENIKAIDALAEQGLRPHIGARFDLSDAAEALLCLQARTAIGKIAIMIS